MAVKPFPGREQLSSNWVRGHTNAQTSSILFQRRDRADERLFTLICPLLTSSMAREYSPAEAHDPWSRICRRDKLFAAG